MISLETFAYKKVSLWFPDTGWIWQGHTMDMTATQICPKKNEILDMIQYNMLPVFKYPGNIAISAKLKVKC